MLPPRVIYSAEIHNSADKEVTVVASYRDFEDKIVTKEIVIPAGGVATAPERTYQRGSATFAMEISRLEIKVGGAVASSSGISAPFPGVHSPTKDYPIEIVDISGALQLETRYPE